MTGSKSPPVPVDAITRSILVLRGHKVMLDSDLARLYEVPTKALVQAVKRNLDRFPRDFMFRATRQEIAILRSQFVTSSWGGRRTLPYVFTEQGVAMLSSVLRSRRAIAVNVAIMRAFVRMRETLTKHKALARRLAELERRIDSQDDTIVEILSAIRQLMAPSPIPKRRPIGFVHPKEH